jgi:Notch-like protein
LDSSSSFSCSCFPGYSGPLCQFNTNECASNPCQFGGTCTDSINGYSCACLPGTNGTMCEVNFNDCASNPCQNGGTCLDGLFHRFVLYFCMFLQPAFGS